MSESPAPGEVRRTLLDYVQHDADCDLNCPGSICRMDHSKAETHATCDCGLDLLLSGEGRAPEEPRKDGQS